ncbi:MAG TPA: hypothetical protein VJR89_10385 [Polyangiales bacterium]|nr:hypothetical protein [Polyangiales bacterium]
MAPANAVAGAAGNAHTIPSAGVGSTASAVGADQGEYFVSGAWRGYVWTAAVGMGSRITPMHFKLQTTGMPRCVAGSVAQTSDYSGTASLGFNLAEERSSAGALMTVVPSKAEVMIQIANRAGSELRLQVHGRDASAAPWCAPLPANGGFVAWTSFNTKCWDGSGATYNREPIAKISVLVPGKTTASVAFDFCVQSLTEADGATPAATSGGTTPPSGTTGNSGSATMPPTGTSNGTTREGCDGYATGYWDCCKPHCSWPGNVPGGTSPLATCDKGDRSLGSNADARSACDAGGSAYQCHSLVPWAINDKLSYGYAAVAASADRDVCGKCYELQFTGSSHNSEPDQGSTSLAGKSLIVQAINIGSDVQGGQFDVLIPGRGVGMFDACSSQWGVARADLGEQYGGLLLMCQKQQGRNNDAAVKACVMQSCMNVFEAHGLTELAAGCEWFVNWFGVADNPKLKYRQVSCPAELANKGLRRNAPPSNACLR